MPSVHRAWVDLLTTANKAAACTRKCKGETYYTPQTAERRAPRDVDTSRSVAPLEPALVSFWITHRLPSRACDANCGVSIRFDSIRFDSIRERERERERENSAVFISNLNVV